MAELLSIGDAALATGVSADTIRYYEKIGLLAKPPRTAGNYRSYAPNDVRRIGFVRRARELGFPLEQVRTLLDLAALRERECHGVDALAQAHLHGIDRRIEDLAALRRELATLLAACRGGRVAECRILDALAPEASASQA